MNFLKNFPKDCKVRRLLPYPRPALWNYDLGVKAFYQLLTEMFCYEDSVTRHVMVPLLLVKKLTVSMAY